MTKHCEPLPLFILAGSDERRCNVPRSLHGGDLLVGYKGAVRLASGVPLVAEVAQRFMDSGRFQKPVLVGPARVYRALDIDCEIVDSEGDLSKTLARTIATIHERVGTLGPVAITACDILPSASELTRLLDHHYEPNRECVFFGQFARAEPEAMGASSWKPGYGFAREDAGKDNLYPGHLIIIRPEAIRLELTTRLLHLAYRHRNTPLIRRAFAMSLQGLGVLLYQDLRNLFRLQLPVLTLSIPYICWRAYLAYSAGRLSVSGFEKAVSRLFVHRACHHRNGGRPVVFAITDILSLAKDMDTKAELHEATNQLGSPP